MIVNTRLVSMALLACALLASPVVTLSQEGAKCAGNDTIRSCRARLLGIMPAENAATVTNKASELMALFNTGEGASSTITDFLPWIRLLFDNGAGTATDGEKIGFEYRNPLHLSKYHQNKISVVLEKSGMFEPLKEALQGASLGDEVTDLADGIGQADDARIVFSYSPASKKFGRDPDLNDDLLGKVLHAVSKEELKSEAAKLAREASVERENFIKAHTLDEFIQTEVDDEVVDQPFEKIPDEFEAEYIALTQAWIEAEIGSVRSLAGSLATGRFYDVLDLVNNQPQFVASVEYRSRDEVVGPDELAAKVSYEVGGPNINSLRQHIATCADREALSCYAAYLDDKEVQRELASGSVHFKFSAEYSEVQRLEFSLPDPAFDYVLKPVKHLSVSAGMGRYFGPDVSAGRRARFDLTASYEDFSDDPSRQDRGLANLTVTYPISGGFFLSVGAVYATKPEFRGDVDEEISARAGFTYKIVEE